MSGGQWRKWRGSIGAKYSRPCPRYRAEARLTEPVASFEDHLAREIIQSERTRMAILAGLLAALVVVFGLLYALFHEDYLRRFISPGAFIYALAAIGLLFCYELAIRFRIGRWLEQGRSVPGPLRYLNAFVETSVPSILIHLLARETEPVHVLQSAAGFLYVVFIVLSTLRLDFRLSVFTGLVAAAEYVALSYAYLDAPGAADTPFAAPPYYLAKGAVLVLAGLAAGFVAHQLKRRVGNLYRTLQER